MQLIGPKSHVLLHGVKTPMGGGNFEGSSGPLKNTGINLTFLSWLLKERCYGNWFFAWIGKKIGIPHLHYVCWPSTTDGRTATQLRMLTPLMISDKNLVNFGPVTSEFCRCVCTGRATRWPLPRISSYYVGDNAAGCGRWLCAGKSRTAGYPQCSAANSGRTNVRVGHGDGLQQEADEGGD